MKPGYKQTEVGVIPEEWETRPCSEVSERIMVGIVIRPTQYYVTNGVPAFRSANIRENGINDLDLVFISDKSNAVLAKSQTRTGDVLTVRTGYPGTSAVVHSRHEGCNCIDILITRPSKKLNSEWLTIWINSPFGKEQVLRNQGGLAQKHFNVGDMRNLVVALPPLPEQRAIATALSDVDGLLGGLDRLIAKKRDLKQAAMQQLLTGQTRLPGWDGAWEVKRFGEVAFPRRDRVDPRRTGTQEFCVELEHIASGSGELLGSTSTGGQSSLKSVFRPGDVLFGKLRAYLRKYWLATRAGVCSTEVWVFTPKDRLVTTEFLFQLIKTDEFIEAASNSYGTHMPRSDWNIVKNYELKLPFLPEQTAIAEVLTEMDGELAGLEQRREKTRALKQAMMQELLTGRTRLL